MTSTSESTPAGARPRATIITSEIEKPDPDNRSYRVIRLPNKLEVLLTHDPDTDKASAAIDVHVGNFADSDDLQGQAHAVEHLLFMGTEKYPKENEYSQYLSEHSGHSNAYTATTSTNYYFEVGHEYLRGALDRFAQFFICPLFLEETLDRELKAVDSEHKKNLQSDTWRLWQLSKSMSNPKHPFHHFSTGNLQTLKEEPAKRGLNVRDEFIKFHEKHYSANIMKLAIIGRESLDELQALVEEMFSDVQNKDIPDPAFEAEPLTEEHLGIQYFAKPVMDRRSIELTFPFMDEDDYYMSHPSRYISHLIGHEGPGSILAYLKKKGWATSLSAGANPIARGSSFFQVTITLTEAGLDHYEDIVTAVFNYINLLKDEPVHEWVVRELQNIADVDFKFREKSSPSKFVSRITAQMHKPYPRELLLSAPTRIREYNPELITKGLEYLRPDNFRVCIVSPECPKGEFDKVEYWYKTQYKVEKIPESLMAKLKEATGKGKGAGSALKEELFLPAPNEFVPTNFDVVRKEVEKKQVVPNLIKDTKQARIWFKKDDTFWVPKANVYFTLRNPLVYASPYHCIVTRMYCNLVKDALNEYAYDAEIAGLDYDLSGSAVGLEIEISGYNDKMPILLEKVLYKMKDLEVREDRFNVMKERLLRAYRNWGYQPPYQQVSEYARYIGSQTLWLNDDLLSELEQLTVEDVKILYPKLLRSAHIEALVHGNLHKEDALKYIDLVEAIIQPRPLPSTLFGTRRSVLPPPGSRAVWNRPLQDENNVNSVIEYSLYIGEQSDRRLKNLLTVFSQLAEEPAFDQLRTKEQLGYIVFSGYRYTTTAMAYRIIVQSERSAPYLESRIEEFLKNFKQKLESQTEKEFQDHVKAVILRLTEKMKNLSSESSRLWNRIGTEVYDFESDDADAEVIRTIEREEIMDFYNKYIDPSSPTRAKVSIQMPAAVKPAPVEMDEQAKQGMFAAVAQFYTAKGVATEPKEVAAALENVNLGNPEQIAGTLYKFLQEVKNLSGEKLQEVHTEGAELLKSAVPPEPKAEDFGEVIQNVVVWKAGCPVTAGARPIKPLVEFQDSSCKL